VTRTTTRSTLDDCPIGVENYRGRLRSARHSCVCGRDVAERSTTGVEILIVIIAIVKRVSVEFPLIRCRTVGVNRSVLFDRKMPPTSRRDYNKQLSQYSTALPITPRKFSSPDGNTCLRCLRCFCGRPTDCDGHKITGVRRYRETSRNGLETITNILFF